MVGEGSKSNGVGLVFSLFFFFFFFFFGVDDRLWVVSGGGGVKCVVQRWW